MSDSSSSTKSRKPPFRAKLDLINDGLATKKKIKFNYTNQKKEKSTRTMQPSNFVGPGEQYTDGYRIVRNLCIGGHCQLSKASRVFNISKMEAIKLVKSWMGYKPNYNFERKERERLKVEKKAARQEAKKAKSDKRKLTKGNSRQSGPD